jgi:hypothetical protein
MKIKINTVICALAVLLGIFAMPSINASSATPAEINALRSPDALRNYALSRAVIGYVQDSCPSLDWNFKDNHSRESTNGTCAEDVLQKLAGVKLSYRITNPNDKITSYAYLFDADKNYLFGGSSTYDVGGKEQTVILYQYRVPMFSNVSSAEVIGTDDTGASVRTIQTITVTSGKAMIDPWITGKSNGLLVLHYKDGTSETIDLGTGRQNGDINVGNSQTMKIDNHYIFEDPAKITITALYERPTVYFTTTVDINPDFDVAGIFSDNQGQTAVEVPETIYVSVDGGAETTVSIAKVKKFPAGHAYRVRFEWNEFGNPGTFYVGPVYDGKGV